MKLPSGENHKAPSRYKDVVLPAGFEISKWMHLSIGQVDYKNHLSECTIRLSEIYKASAT